MVSEIFSRLAEENEAWWSRRVSASQPEQQPTQQVKIETMLKPAIAELQTVMLDAAMAIKTADVAIKRQVIQQLMERCPVAFVSDMPEDNPTNLLHTGGQWEIQADAKFQMPDQYDTFIRELVHELGAMLILEKMQTLREKQGEQIDLNDQEQLYQLKADLVFDNKFSLTHLIDRLLEELVVSLP